MIGESFGVKFSDSDTVKSYIKEVINRFHETSTDTKFSPIIHPPLIRKASSKAACFYAQGTVVDLTKAFCGSSSQKPLHPFHEENQCIRERRLQRRHSGQCDFSSKDIPLS